MSNMRESLHCLHYDWNNVNTVCCGAVGRPVRTWVVVFGAGRTGGRPFHRVSVAGAGLAGWGAGGRAEPTGSARETLGCVGDTWTKVWRCFKYTHTCKKHPTVSWRSTFTFYLDVLQQHRLDHLPPHQYPSGSPVQDVGTRLQAHLRPRCTQWATHHMILQQLAHTEVETRAHRVCVPFSIVGDFYPFLIISLSHFLALLILDLRTS